MPKVKLVLCYMLLLYCYCYRLRLKKDKSTEYVIGWESKGVYGSKLIALHGAFLPKHKIF